MTTTVFGGFGAYGESDRPPGSWLGALATSTAVYAGLGAAVLLLGSATKAIVTDREIEISFVEKVVRKEPDPPPLPPVPVEKAKPAAAAPVVPKDMKVRKLEAPLPPKEIVAPKEMPREAPREADPSEDAGIAVYGDPADGDPAGREGGGLDAIALPEDALPPIPVKDNPVPIYPQQARAEGRTGVVILKIIIMADGKVAEVRVMRGEEPFVGAAVAAVRNWRYEPARYNGRAVTVYRIVQIPFKLTV